MLSLTHHHLTATLILHNNNMANIRPPQNEGISAHHSTQKTTLKTQHDTMKHQYQFCIALASELDDERYYQLSDVCLSHAKQTKRLLNQAAQNNTLGI